MLKVFTLELGQMATNCYLVADEKSSECLIIDPADEGDQITQKILDEKLHPTAIILTHGHFDHVLACLEVKLNFAVPIYLHPADNFLLKQAQSSAKHFLGLNVDPIPPADLPLSDDQVINLGTESLKVIHTPGHTPGSICLLSLPSPSLPLSRGGIKGEVKSKMCNVQCAMIFTGDTLFSDAVGRTDLSYSSPTNLQKSLQKLKFQISNFKFQIDLYPGHGPSCPIVSSGLYPSNQEYQDL